MSRKPRLRVENIHKNMYVPLEEHDYKIDAENVYVSNVSMWDMYEIYHKTKDHHYEKGDTGEFHGMHPKEYDENLKRNSRVNGAVEIKPEPVKMDSSLTSKQPRVIRTDSIDKGRFNIPRVLNNHPLNRVIRKNNPKYKKNVKLYINLSANCGYGSKAIQEFSIKCLRIVETFHSLGYKVDVAVTETTLFDGENDFHVLNVLLPARPTKLQMQHVISVETMRRFSFAVIDNFENIGGGLGRPIHNFINLKDNEFELNVENDLNVDVDEYVKKCIKEKLR